MLFAYPLPSAFAAPPAVPRNPFHAVMVQGSHSVRASTRGTGRALQAFTALRQSCCHPQIVRRRDQVLGKERLSMREIMEKLVVKVRRPGLLATEPWRRGWLAGACWGLPTSRPPLMSVCLECAACAGACSPTAFLPLHPTRTCCEPWLPACRHSTSGTTLPGACCTRGPC